MERKQVIKTIENPTAEYRGKPFWSWNGKLEKEELLRQIDVLKEMGFGGFFMHSRTGLETEYLGEEWFECIRACAEKAKELGMEAWLYDEDRWPSGLCGGEVTRERKNRLRFLSLYASEREALACKEVAGIICRFAVRLEKDANGEDRLADFYPVSDEAEVKSGYRYAVFAEEEQACEDFYNGFTYINAMDGNVTERFLESTHEKYARYCGDLLGTVIKGIFTDEPHRGALFNGFGLANANRSRMAPYTAELFAAYEKKFGEELAVPALYWRKKGEDFNRTACNYIDVVDDLFTQNFAKPCREWCEAHGMKLTGHILHEDNLSIQASVTGSCMRYYEYMDYPGIDVLAEDNNVYWAAKQCASVARQLGKKYVLSELYGATGWDMTLNRYKTAGDWQALFGVNLRCPHLSWYTMKGEAKRDYPASILHQNAWYREWKDVEDYFSRLGVLSAEGERICDTLVLVPMREMWGKVHMGWMDGFAPNDKAVSALDEQYIADFKELTEQNIDFDYGDEELLRKYGKVVKENGRVYLQVGEVRYGEVLLECGGRVSGEVRRILDEYVSAGGKLTERIEELTPSFRIKTPKGTAYAAYKLGGDLWVFLLNLDKREKSAGEVVFPQIPIAYHVEKWDFREGKSLGRVATTAKKEGFGFPLVLAGGEECILRLTEEEIAEEEKTEYPVLPLPNEFLYKLNEPNVLPLDYAVWETDGKLRDEGREKDVLLIDREIRYEKGSHLRGGGMLQPWFVKKYGGEKGAEKLCCIKLTFTFDAEDVPEKVWLVKEDGKLSCSVNGKPLNSPCDRYWVDKCFKLYPIELKKGKNEICLTGEFYADDGLEALYLLGNFGVKLQRTLVRLPEKLTAGDISAQGLPYYTGGIEYHTGISQGKYTVEFPSFCGAGLKVLGGKKERHLFFAPYTAQVELEKELVFELALPRRNTFGPLHQPYPQACYSPDSYLTFGQNRTDDFIPIPYGLKVLEK